MHTRFFDHLNAFRDYLVPFESSIFFSFLPLSVFECQLCLCREGASATSKQDRNSSGRSVPPSISLASCFILTKEIYTSKNIRGF